MPTTDIAGSLSLTNLGPVTGTFTAPESCATSYHGGFYGLAPGNETPAFIFMTNCDNFLEIDTQCFPNGEKIEKMWDDAAEADGFSPYPFPYYSPALHCPSSYETVGVAVANNATVSVSGAFAPTTAYWPGGDFAEDGIPYRNFPANAITTALGPEETAVICCPSGYTADPYFDRCFSMFPASELAGQTGCNLYYAETLIPTDTTPTFSTVTETFVYDGVTTSVTNIIGDNHVQPTWMSWPGNTYTFDQRGMPTPVSSIENEPTFLPRNHTGYVGLAVVQMMYLFHNSSDLEREESAAAGLPATNMWTAAGAILAVWGVGAIAGAGLIAAF